MRQFFLIALVAVTLMGCRTHAPAVVNASAEFDASEQWTLVAIRDKEIGPGKDEVTITLQVNPEAGTFNGQSGCNRFFGNFKDMGNGAMKLSDLNATKKACSEKIMQQESNFMQLLRRCDGYELDQYSLILKQGDKTMLRFEKR